MDGMLTCRISDGWVGRTRIRSFEVDWGCRRSLLLDCCRQEAIEKVHEVSVVVDLIEAVPLVYFESWAYLVRPVLVALPFPMHSAYILEAAGGMMTFSAQLVRCWARPSGGGVELRCRPVDVTSMPIGGWEYTVAGCGV